MNIGYSRSLSIIVPLLNEEKTLAVLLAHLETADADEVILVDGGSSDGTVAWLTRHASSRLPNCQLVTAEPGRANQMNIGARHASGDMLLFLHADTQLPYHAKREICKARDDNYFWGRFDVAFTPSSSGNAAMKVIAFFVNIRSRLSSIATGDQAIFIDRPLFNTIGGFPNLPLMEDVALSKALKAHGVPYCSRLTVQTSPRRWQQGGIVRTVLLMWVLRLAFFAGVSPTKLANWYRNAR